MAKGFGFEVSDLLLVGLLAGAGYLIYTVYSDIKNEVNTVTDTVSKAGTAAVNTVTYIPTQAYNATKEIYSSQKEIVDNSAYFKDASSAEKTTATAALTTGEILAGFTGYTGTNPFVDNTPTNKQNSTGPFIPVNTDYPLTSFKQFTTPISQNTSFLNTLKNATSPNSATVNKTSAALLGANIKNGLKATPNAQGGYSYS